MNNLDFLIVGLVIWAVVEGLHRGLISQLIDLAAFVVSLALAMSFGSQVAARIDHYVALPVVYQPLIGFLVVLVVLEIVVRMVLRLLGHIIPGVLTASLPNRLLGVVPALAKQAVILALLINAVAMVPQWTQGNRAVQESRFAPLALSVNRSVTSSVKQILGPQISQLEVLP
jgi:uncharacterized membrane protein required for colicin V production